MILFGPPREALDFDGVEVQILDRETFERMPLPDDVRHVVVSITDPRDERVWFETTRETKSVLRVAFHDIAEPTTNLTGIDVEAKFLATWMKKIERRGNPEGEPPPRLIVHCIAGISRSAAVAAVWLKMWKRDPSRLFELYCPNEWVIRSVEALLSVPPHRPTGEEKRS